MSKFWLGFLTGIVSYRLVMALLWSILTLTQMILSAAIVVFVIGSIYWLKYRYTKTSKNRKNDGG
jgi:hypothetical protein